MPPRVVYSRHASQMLTERNIRPEWVLRTIETPDVLEDDPRQPAVKRAFLTIPENGNRVLRVAYTESQDEIRIITFFFDRRRKTPSP